MEEGSNKIVEVEMSRRLSRFSSLPEDLRDLVEQNCGTLIELTEALQRAGKDLDDVRCMVAVLISTYEADLVRVMKDRR